MPATARNKCDFKLDQRVEMVCSHITYEIATGVFEPETKLPTVRDAARRWNVDHRIILKAYKRLEALGLVRIVPRSGYFVCVGESHDLVSRHRFELEAMFDSISDKISQTTNLSVLGAFRYLANLAEIRAKSNPECVFVECTQIQARGHAAEVTEMLAIPCLSMTTDQIGGKPSRVPRHVRTVLVTGFHFSELRQLADTEHLNLLSVPIEVSPALSQAGTRQTRTLVFESDGAQAQHMADDIKRLQRSSHCQLKVTSDVNSALADLFRAKRRQPKIRALLSPRLWGRVEAKWRDHANVELIEFRIVPSAWPSIADAIGLPLGTIAVHGDVHLSVPRSDGRS